MLVTYYITYLYFPYREEFDEDNSDEMILSGWTGASDQVVENGKETSEALENTLSTAAEDSEDLIITDAAVSVTGNKRKSTEMSSESEKPTAPSSVNSISSQKMEVTVEEDDDLIMLENPEPIKRKRLEQAP